MIDRPETSDTRQALQSYDIFKQAPFVAAANATKLSEDSTEAVAQNLGARGISYAIADQVENVPGVRVIPMHKTLPSDPRYPYSQPLAYAYKGPTPNPAVAAFLGIAAPPTASAEVPASPQIAPASPPVAQAPAQVEDGGFPWWLLLIPALGGLAWWLLTRSRPTPAIAPVAVPPVVAVPPTAPVTPVTPVAPVVVDEQEPSIKLYEERLVADKTRQKVGDVAFDKRVETDQVQVSVPIETERVVIERSTPTGSETFAPGNIAFGEGETRIETYAETPDIHKETFVREEVSIRKELDHETASVEETLRREELDIDMQSGTDGSLDVDRNNGHVKK